MFEKLKLKNGYKKPDRKKIKTALRQKDIQKRLLFTVVILIIVKIGCEIPIPGINRDYIKQFFEQYANNVFDFFNAFTGGSFENMSVFALNITPYITSSIILQLLTVAIPKLEEIQKDGEAGRKNITKYTRILTVGLALLESTAMSIGFGRQGLFQTFNTVSVILAVCAMTAGSALLVWFGEQITAKGIGNGISVILAFNILTRMPADIDGLFTQFVWGKSIPIAVLHAIIILTLIIFLIWFTARLTNLERHVPIQYSNKAAGKYTAATQTHIPIKLNIAGVIPVIFASSLMQLPVIIGALFGKSNTLLSGLNQGNWLNPDHMKDSWGLIIYILLTYFFAYFYTSITFNPMEVAKNLKKSGATIPGIRPGQPTEQYLQDILKPLILLGTTWLIAIQLVPILCSGVLKANVSFGGTSLIIVVGVVIELIKQLETYGNERSYKGFLNL